MKKIKPVLRYPGSKYRKIDRIISILQLNEKDKFLDMFGGSGIVGVNVKNKINCDVIINDFDEILPVNINNAIKNMLSFQGMGRNFTKSSLELFNKRIENGYWNKLKIYNNILNNCTIIHRDWVAENKYFENFKFPKCDIPSAVYVDPPYHNIKGLYKNDFSDLYHERLKNLMDKLDGCGIKVLISYNESLFIRELYKDWIITEEEFQYQTGKLNRSGVKKKVNELFITNFKIGGE